MDSVKWARVYILVIVYFNCSIQVSFSTRFTHESLRLDPPSDTIHYVHTVEYIAYNVTTQLENYMTEKNSSKFYLTLNHKPGMRFSQRMVNIDSKFKPRIGYKKYSQILKVNPEMIEISTRTNRTASDSFKLEINGIGYNQLDIRLVEQTPNGNVTTVLSKTYKMVVQRKQREVDIGFNVSIMMLMILNAHALGCVTDTQTITKQLMGKFKLALSIVTQYALVPLVTFGLAKVLQVQHEIALGFLFATCIPGGGLGYLIVAITSETDVELSVAINMLEYIIPLGMIPAIVYSFCQLLPNNDGQVVHSIYLVVLWIFVLALPYILGILIRRRKQTISDALLNWFIKPLLLLAFILFITLGLYINMYIFSVLETAALITGGVIPFIGFVIGGALTLLTKQGKPAAKTIAIESAIMNCMAVIVALRFTLPQPDADLASAGAMWVMFVTPVPFLVMFIFHKIKRKIMSYFKKRELEKQKQATILQSFAAITQNALQLGGLNADARTLYTNSNLNESSGDRAMLIRSPSSHDSDPSHVIVNNMAIDKDVK